MNRKPIIPMHIGNPHFPALRSDPMALPVSAEPGNNRGDRDVDVMTVNLYVGGDIAKVLEVDPSDPAALVGAVTEVYYDIVASNPPVRMQTLAEQIAMRQPDMVALQEVSLIRVQSPGDLMLGGDSPATVVVYDYVEMLVAALADKGVRYHVVATGLHDAVLFDAKQGLAETVGADESRQQVAINSWTFMDSYEESRRHAGQTGDPH